MLSKKRAASLFSTAVVVGLTGRAFGQYTANGIQLPTLSATSTYAATDDAADNTTMPYYTLLVQSIQDVTVPNGTLQGDNAPYMVGTMSYRIQTGWGFSGSYYASYTTSTTAFYYSPTTGVHFFGQYSPTSTSQYLNDGATYTYNSSASTYSQYNSGGIVSSSEYHTSTVADENSSAVVIANEQVNSPSSTTLGVLGQYAYAYNIPTNTYTQVGLTSAAVSASGASYSLNFNYSNNAVGYSGTSTGTIASSTDADIDSAGDVSGTSTRYYNWGGVAQSSSSSSALGTSTFFYNATTGQSVETGLYGNGYSYVKTFTGTNGGTGSYSFESDKGVNGGYSVGLATCYNTASGSTTQVGTQAWEYSSLTNTTTAIGLYQSGATPSVAGFGSVNASGTALSFTYNNSNTTLVSSTDRSSAVTALNALGQAGGNDSYYASTTNLGQMAWIYTPTTNTYKQVGLLTNGYQSGGTSSFVSLTAQENSTASFLNNKGQAAGYSTQYVSSGAGGTGNTSNGTVAWFQGANSPTAVQIGLTDAGHTAVNLGYSYTFSTPSHLSNNGLVAGASDRFATNSNTQEGQDAWVYDSNTGQTYIMEPTPAEFATQYAGTGITLAPGNFFYSTITYLSDTGYATGYWSADISTITGSGQSPPATEFGFIWNEATNTFTDLTSDLSPSIGTGEFASDGAIFNPYYVSNDGSTIYAQAGASNNGVQSATTNLFVLSPVPEPTSMILLAGVTGFTCLGRRRRNAKSLTA